MTSALCTPPALAAYFDAPLPVVLLAAVIGAGAATLVAGVTSNEPGAAPPSDGVSQSGVVLLAPVFAACSQPKS